MPPINFPGQPPVVPAVPQKTFPHAFIRDLQINARTNGAGDWLYCEIVPYDASTGEMLPGSAIEIRVPLWAAVAAVPELQVAMGAILAAVEPTVEYQASLNAPEPEPES